MYTRSIFILRLPVRVRLYFQKMAHSSVRVLTQEKETALLMMRRLRGQIFRLDRKMHLTMATGLVFKRTVSSFEGNKNCVSYILCRWICLLNFEAFVNELRFT